ncbi:MAG: ribonuclease III, partial [Candidatus Levybacteria bacterium RBG_13_35_9]
MTKLPQLKNKNLFDQAFTHRSYLNETKEKVNSNERLEFLGDSIISFVISNYLYIKYPQFNEGILTNIRSLLVNTKSLAEIAKNLGIGKYLKLSKGEEDSKGRENQSLLADSFEAFIGSLFLDHGIGKTEEFIIEIFGKVAEEISKGSSFKDPKSLLQEHVQGKKQNSPLYKVLKEIGPAHAKTFIVGVFVGNSML